MEVDFYRGAAAIRRFVSGHCVAHALAGPVEYRVSAMMPNLYLRLAGSTAYRFADGRIVVPPAASLLGPTTAAFDLSMAPGTVLVCVALLPEGWPALSRVPAPLLADDLVDAGLLWPAAAVRDLLDAVAATAPDASCVVPIDGFLSARAAALTAEVDRRLVAVDGWIEEDRALSVDRLCGRLDLGARQATRLTRSVHGVGPKTLAMKYRALRAATTLAVSGRAAMPGALAPYADQSHMIRDFRRFVGWTPAVFARERLAASSATILGRWRAGFRPLGIWG